MSHRVVDAVHAHAQEGVAEARQGLEGRAVEERGAAAAGVPPLACVSQDLFVVVVVGDGDVVVGVVVVVVGDGVYCCQVSVDTHARSTSYPPWYKPALSILDMLYI